MLAEVPRSDFLPIRSFAGHCRSFVWLDFPIMRSYEAPGHLLRLNFRPMRRISVLVARIAAAGACRPRFCSSHRGRSASIRSPGT